MSAQNNYWKECISIAAEECELALTEDQLNSLAESVKEGHENYGMAFYSPPASDRLDYIEREWKTKLKEQQEGHERYVRNAETAVKRALRLGRDSMVSIESYGDVMKHDGRTSQIQ